MSKIDKHINEIMFRSNYRINESPKYHQVIEADEVFDDFPKDVTEADELPPIEKPEEIPPVEDKPEVGSSKLPPVDDNPMPDPMMPEMPVEPQISVDDIQNDIIKTNLEAMKHINDQLKSLDDFVKNIDSKMNILTSDVEEVRAPSNGEKLMKQKNVSYPYYYNLNDYWEGNSFNQKKEDYGQGITKLEDGTFIANFDDLPKTMGNIDKTFNDY